MGEAVEVLQPGSVFGIDLQRCQACPPSLVGWMGMSVQMLEGTVDDTNRLVSNSHWQRSSWHVGGGAGSRNRWSSSKSGR